MKIRRALFFSILTFVFVAFIRILYQAFLYKFLVPAPGNDMWLSICMAGNLLHGIDPYSCRWLYDGVYQASYPLTTVLIAIPFVPLGQTIGAIFLWSITVSLLNYGILRSGKYWRLLIFASPIFLITFNHLQWSALIAAVYLLPDLLPISIVKPQTAIPLILTFLTKRRILWLGIFVALTFVVDPTWLFSWLSQAAAYNGFIPLLVLPLGPLLLMAFLNCRDKRSLFMGITAFVPQRGTYDQLVFFMLAETPIQMVLLLGLSWVGYLLVYSVKLDIRYETIWITFVYLPITILVTDLPKRVATALVYFRSNSFFHLKR